MEFGGEQGDGQITAFSLSRQFGSHASCIHKIIACKQQFLFGEKNAKSGSGLSPRGKDCDSSICPTIHVKLQKK
jgi:hypothetical protein